MNLVDNAIKFTDRGEVVVRITCGPVGLTIPVSIAVADTGRGIPAAKLQDIFQHFTQADSSVAEDNGVNQMRELDGCEVTAEIRRPEHGGPLALAASDLWLMKASGGLFFAAFSLLSFHTAVSPPSRLHPADLLALCGSHGP